MDIQRIYIGYPGMYTRRMQRYTWSPDKNEQLKRTRGIGFEEVVQAIQAGNLLDDLIHHNPTQYPKQRIYVVQINDYAHMVPYVMEPDGSHFFKTIFPRRQKTRQYLRRP